MRLNARWMSFVALVMLVPTVIVITETASAEGSCTAQRVGDDVELSWTDTNANNMVRRDGRWIATAGFGSVSYTDVDAPADGIYLIRPRSNGVMPDIHCVEIPETPVEGCVAQRVRDDVELSWQDTNAKNMVRRNGRWLATAGFGSVSFTDVNAPVGANYLIRPREIGSVPDIPCVFSDAPAIPNPTPTATPGPTSPPGTGSTERVVHVSIDGLRPDHVTAQLMPNLLGMISQGASTLNARTDYAVTKTLPNHTSQFTGRSVWAARDIEGHRIAFNEDRPGTTIHDQAGSYIASIYDVVHDHGLGTAMYVGKSKFNLHKRTWNGTHGAADTTGEDNGRDKIDVFVKDSDANDNIDRAVDGMRGPEPAAFTFFHIRNPDSAGHDYGWGSPEYDLSTMLSDFVLGELLAEIAADPALAETTTIIVTSDHGGPDVGFRHDDPTKTENYTAVFVVQGPEAAPGADLYELNAGNRLEPGTGRPTNFRAQQPIRTHEMANLALDLLGLPAVPGSAFNADQSLQVGS